MSTQNAVQSTIRRVNEVESDLKKKQNMLKGAVEESKTWWKGEAVKSVDASLSEIEKITNRTYSNINSLKSQLRSLASDIKHADDERRRKLELEKKKREQEKANRFI
ncbi:hypothetical protein [Acetivibrio saccincola]|jgi:uncharacterized protein YukE|uniref:WXG100 family type VII secretion target n=1 Tax=Acetivibrio saccincola TaxID=1677857 RepID=A0A2K9DZY9_9FIRM|nr:hypothetical protein [Acetivibrio saccincola]AUG56176.1 hypothetical protein HVS_01030 [Acetivibrio saccincola]AUG57097.1 hypothetical protein HVS_05835 [Acetivibrio saccincola]PQQ65635.1 hypothetical protein B9R14_01860 [Acetivibrio saccincola]PQQ65658.1 hypothetical protein B9R14_01980 [Acetivibrio saccincola]PQQ65668.1 hypothetical protein B9R14_02035 [Acetivibrio saccincola]